jgi:hypothetical protein
LNLFQRFVVHAASVAGSRRRCRMCAAAAGVE